MPLTETEHITDLRTRLRMLAVVASGYLERVEARYGRLPGADHLNEELGCTAEALREKDEEGAPNG